MSLLGRGEVVQAEAIIEAALAVCPADPNLFYMAGNCRLARGDHAAAIGCYERAVAAAPDFAAALLNLGFAYRHLHRPEEARQALRRCVVLTPDDPAAWLNLTSTYVNEGEPEAGEQVAREAVARCPSSPDIRWNLGLLLLEQGKWREGWQEYRHRFETPVLRAPTYGPDGCRPELLRRLDDLRAGQTVVCHGEQGLGDEILFAGMVAEFIADVEARGATLLLDCNPRLRSVFARNFPVEILASDATASAAVRGRPIDWVMPIGDLAGIYRNSEEDFPQRAGYLEADPGSTAAIKTALAARAGGRPLVGIAWSGGSSRTHSLFRTIPLGEWLPVLTQEACFVSLEYRDHENQDQAYGDRGDELQRLLAGRKIEILQLPQLARAQDYARTFELVSALDLVITVPALVLHVAGAVGTPCWVVMHHKAAWRECSKDTAIPWYPQTHQRFVRGPGESGWGGTLSEVAGGLQSLPPRGF